MRSLHWLVHHLLKQSHMTFLMDTEEIIQEICSRENAARCVSADVAD